MCRESQTQAKKLNLITIRKVVLQGSKVGSGQNSNSITIENIKLVGSVQRVSNSGQKVKFNHCKKTGSSGVKGQVRSNSITIENLKLVGSVKSLKLRPKCQI